MLSYLITLLVIRNLQFHVMYLDPNKEVTGVDTIIFKTI